MKGAARDCLKLCGIVKTHKNDYSIKPVLSAANTTKCNLAKCFKT